MDSINSYLRAREYFQNTFVPKRKQVIQDLRKLIDGIQKETIYQKAGSVVYSATGVVSGGAMLISLLAAPMTGGMSSLMALGFYGGMVSGVADIAHRGIKWGLVEILVDNAETTLKNHEFIFSNLKQEYLLKLIKDIETIKNKIDFIRQIKCAEEKEIKAIFKHLLDIGMLNEIPDDSQKFYNFLLEKGEFMIDLLVSDGLFCRGLSVGAKLLAMQGAKQLTEEAVKEGAKNGATNGAKQVARRGIKIGTKDFAKKGAKQVSKHAAKESAKSFVKAVSVASVGLGLVLDIKTLVSSQKDVSRLTNGNLCDEADKMNSVIKQMETELEYLNNWFEETANQ